MANNAQEQETDLYFTRQIRKKQHYTLAELCNWNFVM